MKKLANDFLELTFLPELGGKIISLKSCRSGQEWLWSPPGNPAFRKPGPFDDFASTGVGGIDECLPTVEAQTHNNVAYSDHGQVWRLPVDIKESTDTHIIMESNLTEVPFRFQRMVILDGKNIHFRYELTNLHGYSVPFIWAFHPLFRIEAGDRIGLQPEAIPLCTGYVKNFLDYTEGQPFSWPLIGQRMNLSRPSVDSEDPYCAKLFFKSHVQNMATLTRSSSEETLTLSWADADCPYFGLWLTTGAWNGHTHVAFEPTNYPADRFSPTSPELPRLGPFSKRHWSFSMGL